MNLSDEQHAFVEAIRDFAKRECGTREQRDALTDNGREPHNAEIYAKIADLGGPAPRSPRSTAVLAAARSTCACYASSSRAARSRWASSR